MIDIKKVSEKKDLIDFVKFPFKLYNKARFQAALCIAELRFNTFLNASIAPSFLPKSLRARPRL